MPDRGFVAPVVTRDTSVTRGAGEIRGPLPAGGRRPAPSAARRRRIVAGLAGSTVVLAALAWLVDRAAIARLVARGI